MNFSHDTAGDMLHQFRWNGHFLMDDVIKQSIIYSIIQIIGFGGFPEVGPDFGIDEIVGAQYRFFGQHAMKGKYVQVFKEDGGGHGQYHKIGKRRGGSEVRLCGAESLSFCLDANGPKNQDLDLFTKKPKFL